jgi:hypothetical protein
VFIVVGFLSFAQSPLAAANAELSVFHGDVEAKTAEIRCEIGRCEVSQPAPFVIRLCNSTSQPRRIIGVASCCGDNCCYDSRTVNPTVVPAHGQVDYACDLFISREGPFSADIRLYLDDGGLRRVTFVVEGVGVIGPVEPVELRNTGTPP